MSLIKAIIFDWAGTTIDFGSRAPVAAFVEVFSTFGIDLTAAEARGPMGLPKLDHIKALGALPRIAEAWQAANDGADFDEAAAQRVFGAFVPANLRVAGEHAELIPGTAAMVADLRAMGIKIGSTTGYTREIMAPILPRAAEQGYAPDTLVCAGDLPAGRPSPLMMYQCFIDLAVWPASACVKVDDTEPGIAEGRAAGCWTVGVSLSGNAVGLSLEALSALSSQERDDLNAEAVAQLETAGADYVIDTVADLPAVIDKIETRIAAGERPDS